MIDLHVHILPGLDDGAEDMETSLAMLKIASEEGIRQMIATPHYIRRSFDNSAENIREKCRELNKSIKKEFKGKNAKGPGGNAGHQGPGGIAGLHGSGGIAVYPGSEVFVSPDVPELVKEGQICTLNDSSYILIELPMAGVPEYVDDVLYRLKLDGLNPVIAHPERCAEIAANLDMLYDFIGRGMLVQMNSGSLTGLYGKNTMKAAFTILRHGMVHFISSDAHTARGRSPRLIKAREIATEAVGADTAAALFEGNARAVLENKTIKVTEPQKVKKEKKFFLPGLKGLAALFGGQFKENG